MAKQDDRFTVLVPAPGLKDLDSGFLAELYDVVSKFGEELDDGKARRVRVAADPPFFILAFQRHPRHITVSSRLGGVEVDHDKMVVFGTQSENAALIVDRKVSLQDLRDAVARIDAEFSAFRSPLTGERMRIQQDASKPIDKMCVEDVFRGRTGGVLLLAGVTPESVASTLDEPDKVVFVESKDLPGRWIMHLKKNVVRTEVLDAIMADLFVKYGITSQGDFDALSDERRAAFHKDVLEEIEKRNATETETAEPEKKA